MRNKNRRLRNLLLIITAAVIVACTTIYLVHSMSSARRSRRHLIDDLLVQADYEISLGYYERAMDSLDKALARSRGEYNILRILKRMYQISYDLNDFSLLNDFARGAANRIPGSEELEQIYLYAAIRSAGRQSYVERLKPGRGKQTGSLSYLHAEAYLAGFLDTPPDEDLEPVLAKIMSLVERKGAATRGAAALDPHQLQRLGTDLDEPKIHLDAALLWMADPAGFSCFARRWSTVSAARRRREFEMLESALFFWRPSL